MNYECPTCNELDYDLEQARARLAEVEAEMVRMGRDHTVRLQVRDEEENDLRARLAAALALCNDGRLPSCGLADRDYDGCYVQAVVQKIRAAAQGETARHYDTEDAHGNPVCVCPDINGEYDGG